MGTDWFPSIFFFSSRRRHTRYWRDWSSDVCSSDLAATRSLGAWLEAEGVPGITGIDTRTLTRRLREHGTMKGWLVPAKDNAAHATNAAETVDMKDIFRLVAPDNAIRYRCGSPKALQGDAG